MEGTLFKRVQLGTRVQNVDGRAARAAAAAARAGAASGEPRNRGGPEQVALECEKKSKFLF